MTTFATVGKKVDDRIADFKKLIHEAVDGIDDSLKSADRLGFERAIKMAKEKALTMIGGNENVARAIEKIPYTTGE